MLVALGAEVSGIFDAVVIVVGILSTVLAAVEVVVGDCPLCQPVSPDGQKSFSSNMVSSSLSGSSFTVVVVTGHLVSHAVAVGVAPHTGVEWPRVVAVVDPIVVVVEVGVVSRLLPSLSMCSRVVGR